MRLLEFVLISLIVHLILAIGVNSLPPTFHETRQPIEVQILSQKETSKQKLTRQIVREALLPDKVKMEESDDPIRFLSAQTQRVKKQVQALVSGVTKNRTTQGESHQAETRQEPLKKNQLHLDPRKKGGLEAFAPSLRPLPNMIHNESLEKGISTMGDVMTKDIPIGSFTALNTDRYLYYSFFSRIEDLIRFRWETMVQTVIDTTPRADFTKTAVNYWTTQLEIWLKPNGEYHSAHLMKEAGIPGFDRAAVQAFAQAKVFPNPPKEMVEADGFIHLKYSFQVRYDPKLVARP